MDNVQQEVEKLNLNNDADVASEKQNEGQLSEHFEPEMVPQREALFNDISADNSFTEMESLCMNCHEQGVTRLLLTRIPHFKEVIIMAFTCPHCGFRSNEIQHGGSISEKAETIELKITDRKDLNRQIVKSETALIRIPELDFEIPANTQRGLLNTIEGFLMQSVEALKEGQEERRKIDPETTQQIDAFIQKLENCATGETIPFTIIVDDLSGNSFIENPNAPNPDPNMKHTRYTRSPEQNFSIGLTSEETPEEKALRLAEQHDKTDAQPVTSDFLKKNYKYALDFDKFNYKEQIMNFIGNCPSCHAPADTRMFAIDIPHFKEVIIMCSQCDSCGYKSSECKAGGAISPKGRRITLRVETIEDLSRDILKSETATVYIPEMDLNVTRGTLGGRFTTVEGLLDGIKEDLSKASPFLQGDSGEAAGKAKFGKFISQLDKLISGEEHFTIIMDDPVANSYILDIYSPEPDPRLKIEEYDRTFEENEELGLNDIKTENYETPDGEIIVGSQGVALSKEMLEKSNQSVSDS